MNDGGFRRERRREGAGRETRRSGEQEGGEIIRVGQVEPVKLIIEVN